MNYDKYISTKKARELLQITSKTLRVWDKEGKINTIRTPSFRRMYSLEDVLRILKTSKVSPHKKKICYARVSSRKQMDDLGRQTNFFRSQFPTHELVTDVGSGINWKRKGLKTILESAMQGHISEIVVAHRDRLCRFAFELLEFIFSQCGVTLLVLNQENEQSTEQELADDILSITHVYSCKQMGKRRYKNKKIEIISKLQSNSDIQEMDGHKKICI